MGLVMPLRSIDGPMPHQHHTLMLPFNHLNRHILPPYRYLPYPYLSPPIGGSLGGNAPSPYPYPHLQHMDTHHIYILRSVVRRVINLIDMYCNFNYYIIRFLKFVVHKMNYEMVKSKIVVLTGREKTVVAVC
jgi:hypothetical protein